jgi:hypothetical protein
MCTPLSSSVLSSTSMCARLCQLCVGKGQIEQGGHYCSLLLLACCSFNSRLQVALILRQLCSLLLDLDL